MTRFSQVTAALRRKSLGQYALLTLCCFVSVLLITAYASMMGSPTVLSVFPEGGDSRKQMTMIFVLAVLGCVVFTSYASGLFFRHKSRDVGILLALGASKDQLRRVLAGELALMSLSACALGALLGTPLAWFIWQGFRLLLVDSKEMALAFDPHAYLLALAFSLFVVIMLFVMLGRFLRRTNILDVVNESRKSEPIRAVPRWYGPLGIILLAAGGFLGYMAPQFFILVLHWYAPDALTALFYLPALAGLYMILLHTVVNGWRRGSSRYRDLITSSMMQFQGRQTVRNMVVVTVLAAGAYFAAFYIPMLSSGTSSATEDREFGYLFHYRADQDMPGREEVLHLAEEMGVTVTRYAQQSGAVLAYDGYADVVSEGPLGTTYDVVYCEGTASDVFLSVQRPPSMTATGIAAALGTASPWSPTTSPGNSWPSRRPSPCAAPPFWDTGCWTTGIMPTSPRACPMNGGRWWPSLTWRTRRIPTSLQGPCSTRSWTAPAPRWPSSTVGTRWSGTVIWQRRATTSWTRPIWNPMDFLPLNMTSGIPATSGIPGNTCPASGRWTRRPSPLPWRFF